MIKGIKHYIIKVYKSKYKVFSVEEETESKNVNEVEDEESLIKFCFFDRKIKLKGESIYLDKGENYSPWIWNGERMEITMENQNKNLCRTKSGVYEMDNEDITKSEYVEHKDESNEILDVLNNIQKDFINYMGYSCANGRIYTEVTRGKIEAMKYAISRINQIKEKIQCEFEQSSISQEETYQKRVSTR